MQGRRHAYKVGTAKQMIKATHAPMGWGLGRGVPSPTNYGVWGNIVSFPSGVYGGAPAAGDFFCMLLAISCVLKHTNSNFNITHE